MQSLDGEKFFKGRRLILLLVLGGFVAVLMLSFSAQSAHAADPPNTVGPMQIIGGGGNGNPPPSNKIVGYVFNLETGQPVVGVKVYCALDTEEVSPTHTYTDNNGHFAFDWFTIDPYRYYYITVNGGYQLDGHNSIGAVCDDIHWGQFREKYFSDIDGYIGACINLEPATVVNVTYAALYSDTKFATLRYGLQTEGSYSHTISFGVENFGFNMGYCTSDSVSFQFAVDPGSSNCMSKEYYAVASRDCAGPSLVQWVGLSGCVPFRLYNTPSIKEYIKDPTKLNPDECLSFLVGQGSTQSYQYSETGSCTWSVSAGNPFGIIYNALSQVISLDETVTATSSTTSYVAFDVHVPLGNGDINFMAYSFGTGGFHPLLSTNVGTGGFELHVFDMDGKG